MLGLHHAVEEKGSPVYRKREGRRFKRCEGKSGPRSRLRCRDNQSTRRLFGVASPLGSAMMTMMMKRISRRGNAKPKGKNNLSPFHPSLLTVTSLL